MFYIIRVLLIVCMFATTGWLRGDAVPLELQGAYVGKITGTDYFSGTPMKSTYSVMMWVEETEWQIELMDANGFGNFFSGSVTSISPYLLGSASSTTTIGGRLQVKGKPSKGNHSLSGNFSLAVGTAWGAADLKVKVKKLPVK